MHRHTVVFRCYRAVGDTGTRLIPGQTYRGDGRIGRDMGHGVSGAVELEGRTGWLARDKPGTVLDPLTKKI